MPRFVARACLLICIALSSIGAFAAEPDESRVRLIVETDAGSDPDDEQSLVRFLLYTNDFDVEAIIANRPTCTDGENLNTERTGPGVVRRLVEAYCECWPLLVQHDPRYPKPDDIRARTIDGTAGSDAGVRAIIAAVDSPDPRPLWFCDWGTNHDGIISNLWRALDVVRKERGEEGYAAFKNRLRLSSNDAFGPHSQEIAPPFPLWIDTFEPESDGRRWYHRFSAVTATAGGFDLERDVRTGHGPLGALYPTNTTHRQKEGDTMAFLYLVPTGMNDPRHPEWGSWAGRYGRAEPGTDTPKNYYWADVQDRWDGTLSRENTLARFATALQNDFRARLDWCVKGPYEANHPPQLRSPVPQRTRAAAGDEMAVGIGEIRDFDGDEFSYNWWFYPEAGTYRDVPALRDFSTPTVQFTVPSVPGELHLVLTVTDSGEPPLERYARFVISVGE
jgi:hypothetical protein